MYLARIFITLKPTINDPEGQTIQRGLRELDFDSVRSVRSGKYLEVHLDESEEEIASHMVKDMCARLLSNPVIEEYHFKLERVTPQTTN